MQGGWKTPVLKGLRKNTPITKETWFFSFYFIVKNKYIGFGYPNRVLTLIVLINKVFL
jgi:hypothetical protein